MYDEKKIDSKKEEKKMKKWRENKRVDPFFVLYPASYLFGGGHRCFDMHTGHPFLFFVHGLLLGRVGWVPKNDILVCACCIFVLLKCFF